MKGVKNTKITTDPPSNFGLDINTESKRQPMLLMCGRTVGPNEHYCNRPVQFHPYTPNGSEFIVRCERDETTPEPTDFYLAQNMAVIPYVDFSGNEAKVEMLLNRSWSEDSEGNILDENDYLSPEAEWNALDRWRDTTPDISTVTLEQHRTGLANEARSTTNGFVPHVEDWQPEVRNAYVEGHDGYLTVKLLDEFLNRKHHEHLLNVFVDKTGTLRVGSCQVLYTVDGKVQAYCVKCKARSGVITPDSVTREEQEDFIYATIRHGNNHAAAFIRDKIIGGVKVWYEINPILPKIESNEVQDLLDHQKYCNNLDCKCDVILHELAPVLT